MGKDRRTLLTDDLIMDIISRVSDKDLKRFTCVSKSWCSLINTTDSYFSRLRSQRTILSGRPFLIIPKRDCSSEGEFYYNYWFELDSIEDGNPDPRQLHNPFDNDHDRQYASVIASCEGLVVFEQSYDHSKMVVSNPTTKEHHVVPPNPASRDYNVVPPNPSIDYNDYSDVVFIGFGYDHVHGCFKLVTRIVPKSRDDHYVELMIYNVSDGTWKKSGFDGLDVHYGGNYSSLRYKGKFVDGALHWSVYNESETVMKKILCYVLAEDKFQDGDPPDFDEGMHNSFLTVFDGRLCFGCEDPASTRMELWRMECDSKGWSWIKFLLISEGEAELRPYLLPICFSVCRNKILFNMEYSQLFWYDIGENKFSEVKTCINDSYGYLSHVRDCVPSFVGIGI